MHLIFCASDDHNVLYTSVFIQQVFTILNKFFFPKTLFHKLSASMLKVVTICEVCSHFAVIQRNCVTVLRLI